MLDDVQLLGPQVKEEEVDAQQCILPLIVLFSIAAQENRAGVARGNRPGYPMRTRSQMTPGMGMARPRVGMAPPLNPRVGMPMTRRGWY